jgi:hypothetical protein
MIDAVERNTLPFPAAVDFFQELWQRRFAVEPELDDSAEVEAPTTDSVDFNTPTGDDIDYDVLFDLMMTDDIDLYAKLKLLPFDCGAVVRSEVVRNAPVQYEFSIQQESSFLSCTLVVNGRRFNFKWYRGNRRFGRRFGLTDYANRVIVPYKELPMDFCGHRAATVPYKDLATIAYGNRAIVPYKEGFAIVYGNRAIALQVPRFLYKDRTMVAYGKGAIVPYQSRSMVVYRNPQCRFNDEAEGVSADDDVGGEVLTIQEVIDLTDDNDLPDVVGFTESNNIRRGCRIRVPTNRYGVIHQTKVELVDDLIGKRIGMDYHGKQGNFVGKLLYFGSVMEFSKAEGLYVVEFHDKGQAWLDEDKVRSLVNEYEMGLKRYDTFLDDS